MTIKMIPRLSQALKLPKNNCISYEDEISNDRVCIKLQKKMNIGKGKTFFFSM